MTRPISTNYGSTRVGFPPAPRSGQPIPTRQPLPASMFSGDDSFNFNLPKVDPEPAKGETGPGSSPSTEAATGGTPAPAGTAARTSRGEDPEIVVPGRDGHTEIRRDRKRFPLAAAAGLAIGAGVIAIGWPFIGPGTRSPATPPAPPKTAEAGPAPLIIAASPAPERQPVVSGTREGGGVEPRALAQPTPRPGDDPPSSGDDGLSRAATARARSAEFEAALPAPPDAASDVTAGIGAPTTGRPREASTSGEGSGASGRPDVAATAFMPSTTPAETSLDGVAGAIGASPPATTQSGPKAAEPLVLPGPPPKPPAVKEMTSAELKSLMARGRELIGSGNIAAARSVLQRAAETQDKDAFFALAETYDPAALARWGVIGVRHDIAMAQKFYELAASKGVRLANDRLASLRP